jgi:tripartite-type tricarboxylate transporter receptor subunit TctC
VDEMVQSEAWKRQCKLHDWQELYVPAAEFASFLKTETGSIGPVLKQLGLVS